MKGKYKVIVYFDDKNVLENFRSYMINEVEQQCLIYDEQGNECFYPEVKWDHKDKNKNLKMICDYKSKYEVD